MSIRTDEVSNPRKTTSKPRKRREHLKPRKPRVHLSDIKAPPNKKRLTDAKVSKLEAKDHRYMVWDTEQKGLVVVVHANTGSKTFKYGYPINGERNYKYYKIGPSSIGIKKARKEAKIQAGRVASGIDVHGERMVARRTALIQSRDPLFKDLVRRYIEEYAEVHTKSAGQVDSFLTSHVIPKLGNHRVSEIRRSDIRSIFNEFTNRGKFHMANQTVAFTSSVFGWAIREEIIDVPSNPCAGIRRNPTKSRERVLTDIEIRDFWRAFTELGYPSGHALKLILLTGQRPGEVTHMRWRDIEFGKFRFTDRSDPRSPKERIVKGAWWNLSGQTEEGWPGTKNGHNHRVWLSTKAIEVLEDCGPDKDGHVLVNSRGTPAGPLNPVMKKLCQDMEIDDPAKPHDLRRTHGTRITGLGYSRDAMNRLQNHREGGIASVYDRFGYETEAMEVQEKVSQDIQYCSKLRVRLDD